MQRGRAAHNYAGSRGSILGESRQGMCRERAAVQIDTLHIDNLAEVLLGLFRLAVEFEDATEYVAVLAPVATAVPPAGGAMKARAEAVSEVPRWQSSLSHDGHNRLTKDHLGASATRDEAPVLRGEDGTYACTG